MHEPGKCITLVLVREEGRHRRAAELSEYLWSPDLKVRRNALSLWPEAAWNPGCWGCRRLAGYLRNKRPAATMLLWIRCIVDAFLQRDGRRLSPPKRTRSVARVACH